MNINAANMFKTFFTEYKNPFDATNISDKK
ncbi:hypothetical protein BPO_1776 [Bergeyella porcorum]|uniref:Uncharacterized protein n=1 Tax=Bergeyella porcorum TaxID=1735111 RepID=A0AAU0F481_9FLAO